MNLGKTRWVIAEGYIPGASTGSGRAFESHETACILNAGEREANVRITLYFADRDPVGPYTIKVPPRDTDYSSVIESDAPIVVPHTRLDSRQAALALLTTIAFPGD